MRSLEAREGGPAGAGQGARASAASHPGSARSSSATTRTARRTSAASAPTRPRSASRRSMSSSRRHVTQADCRGRSTSSTTTPTSTRSSCKFRCRRVSTTRPRCCDRSRQGRRRTPPGEPRATRARRRRDRVRVLRSGSRRCSCTRVPIDGRHVVVVGRGLTIGRPLAELLALKEAHANAAVTTVTPAFEVPPGVHEAGRHPHRGRGSPSIIRPDMVKPGAAVVGAGMTCKGRTSFPTSTRSARGRGLDHAAPRRGRTDDPCDVAAQHGRGRGTRPVTT